NKDNSELNKESGRFSKNEDPTFGLFANKYNFEVNPEDKALKAILERPIFSIRSRLIYGFILFFIISSGITITTIITLDKLEHKLSFLEVADVITNEIQQARRYEKNFFLYGSDLSSVLEHVEPAEVLLTSVKNELGSVVGKKNMETMVQHITKYKELIHQLSVIDSLQKNEKSQNYHDIENQLRTHGAEMVSFALDLSRKERARVSNLIHIAKWVPIIFSLFLLCLILYVAYFLYRHIISRLDRLMKATQRIAEGDFTPIMPTRPYRDEFTNLAISMNSMMHQLKERQDILVRSHKLRAVGTLTAGIAHELNNPINNIMLTAEMLKEDVKNISEEEEMDMISDLVNQAERAQKIVRNLLDFARESEMKTEPMDVGEIIQETIVLVGNQIKIHNVKSTLSIAPNLPPVHGDRQHISQVFLNIILNALDSMPNGGKLKISVLRADESGFIVARFSDTGNGIPSHIINSIFDPFFTTKPTGKGTGLGLSVSLGIIRKHGGDIKVQSKINEGSIFEVLLPISEVPANISINETN
ncbi:HAMP domain-containing protein, partial [bacterium]|nr:HAMP domain-containing protein [bacterium]